MTIYRLQLRYNTTNDRLRSGHPESSHHKIALLYANICNTESLQLRRLVIPLEHSNDPSVPTPSVAAWPPARSIVDVLFDVLFLQTVTDRNDTARQHWRYQQWRRVLSQMKVDSVFRRWLVEYGSGEDVNVTQICDGERLMGLAKASSFGEPSRSIIKLDLLSFRILAQVEVMASRLWGISIKSFDFTFCPILDVTSITCFSRAMPVPEPPGTFSSSTTSKLCYGLPSVYTCTHT